MDPSKVMDTIGGDMLNNTMEGLYRLGKDSKVEPGIATKTTVSKDNLTYTFTLRKNAKWSNGDKVTADDFVYSWRRTVDPKTQSQYSYLFEGVKNIDDITAGKKAPSTLGIKSVGQYKVVVTLTKKIPYFKLLMGFPSFFPQNKTAVEKYGKKYGTSSKYMVYDGPFKMTGWTGTNLSWTLSRNKNYWDKSHVKLDKIKVTLPAFVPKTVVVVGISPEVDIKPVFVRRALTVFQHVLKSPEASAHMVEHTVKHYPDPCLVKILANLGKILVCAQTAVYFSEVPCVVSVSVRLKNRGKVYCIYPQLRHVIYPVGNF